MSKLTLELTELYAIQSIVLLVLKTFILSHYVRSHDTSTCIDVGSSGVKIYAGTVGDDDLTFEQIGRLDNHTTKEDGRHIWNIATLTGQLRERIGTAAAGYDGIACTGIDSTALDFGLLGHGELLRSPYFYRDPSL